MRFLSTLLLLIPACATAGLAAQQSSDHSPNDARATLPEMCAQYQEDKATLNRLMPFTMSAMKLNRMESLYREWLVRLSNVDFGGIARSEQIDWLALNNLVKHDLGAAETERRKEQEVSHLLPFTSSLVGLVEARSQRLETPARDVADIFHEALKGIEEARETLKETKTSGPIARRAARKISSLKQSLANLYNFRSEYDPEFGWWCNKPWEKLKKSLNDYGPWLEKEVGGLNPEDKDALVGDPIGRDALLEELAFERIPYTPEELISIAERELAWCNERRSNAALRLGFKDDWKAAQTSVKERHVDPGEQPAMILDLANEAVDFLEDNNLISIPKLAKESWRMEMMSPARQMISPYFTGGEVISIAYPTKGMDHEAKLQSMRGNNQPYSHATVHHELIPGHHLQGYMAKRWNPQRRMFYTPFLVEGWALYWELQLWDWGFPRNAEEEIGMLFWRSHRCARIIFSLNFHLGNWTPQKCVDFLVANVGHEQRNAEAEVRRSIQGGYGPLYQCAYMLGGLQLRSLYRELVENGSWEKRDFHDAVLRQGPIPVDLVRAALSNETLNPKFAANWRFDN
ncbi:MAG TPA: DUF885 family protein [Planctomycetota bacterium]|jgi:hypothetical protein|nr:DUF885 family protein [Planctomycetota bacterium]HJM38830.1 DUF885 family protein [Planctomycetota bacterium]